MDTSYYYIYSNSNISGTIDSKGYTGEVNLVLSNVDKNILTLGTNGIGYLTKWTFEKTYTTPIVFDDEGNSLNEQCVGFNPSTFWGSGQHVSSRHPWEIHTLSFEIVPKTNAGQKQYYNNVGFTDMVDSTKLLKRK